MLLFALIISSYQRYMNFVKKINRKSFFVFF